MPGRFRQIRQGVSDAVAHRTPLPIQVGMRGGTRPTMPSRSVEIGDDGTDDLALDQLLVGLINLAELDVLADDIVHV